MPHPHPIHAPSISHMGPTHTPPQSHPCPIHALSMPHPCPIHTPSVPSCTALLQHCHSQSFPGTRPPGCGRGKGEAGCLHSLRGLWREGGCFAWGGTVSTGAQTEPRPGPLTQEALCLRAPPPPAPALAPRICRGVTGVHLPKSCCRGEPLPGRAHGAAPGTAGAPASPCTRRPVGPQPATQAARGRSEAGFAGPGRGEEAKEGPGEVTAHQSLRISPLRSGCGQRCPVPWGSLSLPPWLPSLQALPPLLRGHHPTKARTHGRHPCGHGGRVGDGQETAQCLRAPT